MLWWSLSSVVTGEDVEQKVRKWWKWLTADWRGRGTEEDVEQKVRKGWKWLTADWRGRGTEGQEVVEMADR
ncbi:hypothetical protein ACOMHN_062961 [Nucella lapillus]